MGKKLLIYVLFFVIVSTTLETEVKREYVSRLLSDLFIIFSGLGIIFIFIDFFLLHALRGF